MSALERETFTANESRLVRNTDAVTAALRLDRQARTTNHQHANLIAEIAAHEKRKQQLLSWKGEIDTRLAAHLATTKPTHGIERDIWIRTHEELTATLDEIARGPEQWSTGYLRSMAPRDGAPLLPGLIAVQKILASLRTELEAVEATG